MPRSRTTTLELTRRQLAAALFVVCAVIAGAMAAAYIAGRSAALDQGPPRVKPAGGGLAQHSEIFGRGRYGK
jgi:hypothetical protein